jgi:hypothetical protein
VILANRIGAIRISLLLCVLDMMLFLYLTIRRDLKDRVLLFEGLALATFFLGLVVLKMVGVYWPAITIWLGLFVAFTASAAYLGVSNWLSRRKKAS